MKTGCPICKGPLTELKEEFATVAQRYRCDLCGRISWISASRMARVHFVEFALVALVLVLIVRSLPRDLDLIVPTYVGHLIGALVGYLVVAVTGGLRKLLLFRFVSPEPFPESSGTVRLEASEIPFLEALNKAKAVRIATHGALVCTILLVGSFALNFAEWNWRSFPVLALVWVGWAWLVFSDGCPACRRRLLPFNVARWPAVFSAKTCPHCDFKPKYQPRLIEPRTRLGKVAVPAIYAVAIVSMVLLSLRPLSEPGLPSLDAPAKRQAPLDWKMEALDGQIVEASSLHGRVVFLNICDISNARSRREIESIGKLRDALGEGVVIAVVSGEPIAALRQFAFEHNLDVPLYRIEDGSGGLFESRRAPRTYIIDAAGDVRFQRVGAVDWSSEDALRYLSALAAEAMENVTPPSALAAGGQLDEA